MSDLSDEVRRKWMEATGMPAVSLTDDHLFEWADRIATLEQQLADAKKELAEAHEKGVQSGLEQAAVIAHKELQSPAGLFVAKAIRASTT